MNDFVAQANACVFGDIEGEMAEDGSTWGKKSARRCAERVI
jgi:hypothetical protein